MARAPDALKTIAYNNTMAVTIVYPLVIYFLLAPFSYLVGLFTRAELFSTLSNPGIVVTLISTLIFGAMIQRNAWLKFDEQLSTKPDQETAAKLLSGHLVKTTINFFLIVIWQLCVALIGFKLFCDLEMSQVNLYTCFAVIAFGLMIGSVILTAIFTHIERYFHRLYPELLDVRPLSFRITIMVAGLLFGTCLLFVTVNDLAGTAREMGRVLPVSITVSNIIITLTAAIFMVYVLFRLIGETDDLFNGFVGMMGKIKEKEKEGEYLKRQMEQSVSRFKKLFNSLQDAVENKEFSRRIEPESEYDDLALSLNDILCALEQAEIERSAQNWLKNGQAELSRVITGKQDMFNLTSQALQFIAGYCDAVIGSIFILDQETSDFVLTAGHALKKGDLFSSRLKVGEGIAGQAVLQQKTVVVSDMPDDYIYIESSFIMGLPRSLMILPLINEDRVVGVIEVGSLNEFSTQQADFLESAANTLATAVNAILLSQQFSNLSAVVDRRRVVRSS